MACLPNSGRVKFHISCRIDEHPSKICIFRCLSEKLSLYGDAFDLHEKAGASQFTDTYACPCTSAPRKDVILHASKNWHVAVHIDVISCHFDDIFKFAPAGFQDEPEIVPSCQKLLLWVFDN